MKGSTFTGVRGKQLLLTLIAIVCVILLIWAWEKTPLVATIVPQQEHLNVLPHAFLFKNTEEYAENTINLADTLERVNVKEKKEDASPLVEAPETVIVEKDKQDSIVYIVPVEGEVVGAAPMSSPVTNTTKSTEDYNIPGVIPMKKNDCNYAKGKWVADEKRPLYSGFGCKQWLSSMWACRLMQRTDFTYENFHWQPGNCKMPEFDAFATLRRLQDKTIALVGDSLGRQQFQSLMCMLTGGKERPEVEDVGKEYGLARAQGAVRPNGWAYRFQDTNTTIIYYWSASLCELEPLNLSNPSTNYAMHLDRPAWFLKHYLHRFDVLVLNTGHHWNRGKLNANRWEMYVGGMPVANRNIAQIGSAKNFTIYSVIHWLDSQLPHHPRLKAFLRTISPRHFANGDWNTGGSCDNTSPLLRGSRVSQDSSSDAIAEGAVRGTSVKLLDITALSELRDEGHISKYSAKAASGIHDCLHWCLPGVPDTWNEILLAQI